MSSTSIIVHIEARAGCFIAYAKQGAKEYDATSSSPSQAAKLAAAGLLGIEAADVVATRSAPWVWTVTPRYGAFVQDASK